jgi:hypothetical protein
VHGSVNRFTEKNIVPYPSASRIQDVKIRPLLGLVALLGLLASGAHAEMRVWMSRKGGSLEAELGKLDGTDVALITNEAKEVKLKVADLSLADRQYLVEFAGADPSIITSGDPGSPEKDVKIDNASMKRLDAKLGFGDDTRAIFELLETPHFLIGTAGGVRPQAIGETAERLWHGMAFEHMNFRKDWGSKRMLILVVEDRDAYKALGGWYLNFLAGMNQQDAVASVRTTWDKVGSTGITLSDAIMSAHHLMDDAIVFNVNDASNYRKTMSPFPVHCIAKTLLAKQTGSVSSYSSEGYFAITTGHAYFKEIKLAGKTETHLLDVSGTGKDEISSKSGFEDGSSWARTLRPMVRKGQVKPEIAPMFSWKSADLTPERLVLIYSFAHYMQSDAARLAKFATMIRRIESSNQVPASIEIAKIFGFDDVAALEADWTKFIAEGDFK